MITINVFDTPVVLHHCQDKEIFDNTAIKSSIEFVFSLDEVRESVDQSQLGNAFSTSTFAHNYPLTMMPGAEELSEWVARRILESSTVFGSPEATKVEFTRTWINVMFNGCEGLCHSHPLDLDGVAIFYNKVPSNGSELVFIQNGIFGSRSDQYSKEQIRSQPVISGDLIIHKPHVPHAVSKHNSQDSRISFIYEFKYH